MAYIVAFYILIGLICSPFIYFNNAEGYRPAPSKWYQIGRSIGHSFYWPSYVFSIEPEINSKSLNSFNSSIIDIVNYRNEKLFTGEKTNMHIQMVGHAIGSCLIAEIKNNNQNPIVFFDEFFMKNKKLTEKATFARDAVMKKFDGYDFADIISEGEKCQENFLTNLKIHEIEKKIIEEQEKASKVTVPDLVTDCIENPKETLEAVGLRENHIPVHGPIDEDAKGIGCPYRQSPPAGTRVDRGTTVTYRSWWESS